MPVSAATAEPVSAEFWGRSHRWRTVIFVVALVVAATVLLLANQSITSGASEPAAVDDEVAEVVDRVLGEVGPSNDLVDAVMSGRVAVIDHDGNFVGYSDPGNWTRSSPPPLDFFLEDGPKEWWGPPPRVLSASGEHIGYMLGVRFVDLETMHSGQIAHRSYLIEQFGVEQVREWEEVEGQRFAENCPAVAGPDDLGGCGPF